MCLTRLVDLQQPSCICSWAGRGGQLRLVMEHICRRQNTTQVRPNDKYMHTHGPAAQHTTRPRLLFTKTPSRDEDILEQKPFLPESMTDASGGFHGPLTQTRDEKNHSGVTAEDEIPLGENVSQLSLPGFAIGGERRLFHGGFASRRRFQQQQQPGDLGCVTALRISEDLPPGEERVPVSTG